MLFALLATTTLAALVGFTAAASPLRPGDHMGTMLFVRGTAATADLKLFDICDPVILQPGRYVRRCGSAPRVKRLFIGYGSFAPPRAINAIWKSSTWTGWFDGRRIQLRPFGTSDRPLHSFPSAGGNTVTLREWRVMLVNATPGAHTVRYRTTDADGTTNATWNFVITRS